MKKSRLIDYSYARKFGTVIVDSSRHCTCARGICLLIIRMCVSLCFFKVIRVPKSGHWLGMSQPEGLASPKRQVGRHVCS